MPSRYRLVSPPEAVRQAFGLDAIHDFPPRVAIAPTEPVAIVRRSVRGPRELHLVRWGLVPGWAKDPRELSPVFVARAETASEKPFFRGGLRHRRCVAPADGFYVWSGPKGDRKAHLVRRRDGAVMAFAAIADHWLGADGSELETMALLTVPANGTVAPVAERMPVILAAADLDRWLDCRSGEARDVLGLLTAAPDDLLVVEPAGPLPRTSLRQVAGPD